MIIVIQFFSFFKKFTVPLLIVHKYFTIPPSGFSDTNNTNQACYMRVFSLEKAVDAVVDVVAVVDAIVLFVLMFVA